MTKKELVRYLEPWPDDTEIEIDLSRLINGEPTWTEIVCVESEDVESRHCLITIGGIIIE